MDINESIREFGEVVKRIPGWVSREISVCPPTCSVIEESRLVFEKQNVSEEKEKV